MKMLGVISLLLIAALPGEEEWLHLGKEFTVGEETRIQDLLEHPEDYRNRNVKIRGIIASVCNEEGCFIEVVQKNGNGDGIVANFPGLTHTFPLDCTGLEAVVEGTFYLKIYPYARVSHWQHHSFRKGVAVPEFALVMRMNVKAAKIGGSRAAPPAPAEIRKASPHKIDLDVMEFEAEGFGICRKTLKAGTATSPRTTGGARRMIVCLEGSIAVHKEGLKTIVLTANEMAFVSPATVYEIRNKGIEDAVYILVYARKIKKEEERTEEEHGH